MECNLPLSSALDAHALSPFAANEFWPQMLHINSSDGLSYIPSTDTVSWFKCKCNNSVHHAPDNVRYSSVYTTWEHDMSAMRFCIADIDGHLNPRAKHTCRHLWTLHNTCILLEYVNSLYGCLDINWVCQKSEWFAVNGNYELGIIFSIDCVC